MNPCLLQPACHASKPTHRILIMLLNRLLSLPLLCIGLLTLSACEPKTQTNAEPTPAPASADTYFPLTLDGTTLHLQIALSPSEQARGLMYRESLEKDHGMLFVFDQPGPRAFWMRNTKIKLDLAYLDATGTVQEVHKLYPYSETTVPSRSQAVQFVIEMNRGWFNANALGTGAQLDLDAVRKAIRARGQSPESFGL